VHSCFIILEFVVKCLQFTAQVWGNEKAAQLTFLQSQACCHCAFLLFKMKLVSVWFIHEYFSSRTFLVFFCFAVLLKMYVTRFLML